MNVTNPESFWGLCITLEVNNIIRRKDDMISWTIGERRTRRKKDRACPQLVGLRGRARLVFFVGEVGDQLAKAKSTTFSLAGGQSRLGG